VFEQLYLAGDGRLGNVQALGGTAQAAFFKDHQEQAELFDHGINGDAKPHHRNLQSALSAHG
jgi:hypothetical protein